MHTLQASLKLFTGTSQLLGLDISTPSAEYSGCDGGNSGCNDEGNDEGDDEGNDEGNNEGNDKGDDKGDDVDGDNGTTFDIKLLTILVKLSISLSRLLLSSTKLFDKDFTTSR